MKIPYYEVDAFCSRTFTGNPAGVCLLKEWLNNHLLQRIAAENNFAETAFLKPSGSVHDLRWFTPEVEVDLCGHATLAAAHVLFAERGWKENVVRFQSASGILAATKRDELIELDFPSRPPTPCAEPPQNLVAGLGIAPREVLRSRDYFAVYESPEQIRSLKPDMALLAALDCLGIIVTAPGIHEDFVSRFFAPGAGVPEDPVTGSAHCTLIPYWSERLGRTELFARQLSKRGGELHCRFFGDRVGIGGRAVTYCRGEIEIPDSN